MKISIIGYGELGKQFKDFLFQKNEFNLYLFDDTEYIKSNEFHFKFDDYISEKFKKHSFYVALGYKHLLLKNKIIEELISLNRHLPSYNHSTSFINKSAILKESVFIYPMCNVDREVIINRGTLLNNGVIVSHNTIIGNSCYISPGVIISGNVTIGNCTFIGAGSIISNGLTIGNNVKIGIGTVVTSDISDNSNVIGNPMRILKSALNL